ncbi:MAG: WG repeat-containing protein [Cyclobacteriaceae bacterium]|nr:WG repeat-containing protein [Cyclobacteriaceae bacterium]
MKSAFTIILSLVLSTGAFSQTYLTQARPSDKKEWGYINQKGEFSIEAKYRSCYQFSDGYAPIYEDKKFFFINPKGEKLSTEIENFKLFNVFGIGMQGFSDGLVPIKSGDKWGYINTDGKLAIELKYEKASKFDGGFAVVHKNGELFVVNKTGEEFVIAGAIDCKNFSEGLAPYRAADKKFGFVGTDGKTVITAQFFGVGYFIDGVAWAKTMDKKVGFINKKGEWVIEPKFLVAKNFDPTSGLAMVKETEKWVYTNRSGEVLAVDSEKISDFSNGLAKGVKGGKTGYFNKDGKWVIEAKFDGGRDFKNGFAAAKKGDKWGFINKNGEWVIEPSFGAVKDMELIK